MLSFLRWAAEAMLVITYDLRETYASWGLLSLGACWTFLIYSTLIYIFIFWVDGWMPMPIWVCSLIKVSSFYSVVQILNSETFCVLFGSGIPVYKAVLYLMIAFAVLPTVAFKLVFFALFINLISVHHILA